MTLICWLDVLSFSFSSFFLECVPVTETRWTMESILNRNSIRWQKSRSLFFSFSKVSLSLSVCQSFFLSFLLTKKRKKKISCSFQRIHWIDDDAFGFFGSFPFFRWSFVAVSERGVAFESHAPFGLSTIQLFFCFVLSLLLFFSSLHFFWIVFVRFF